MNEYNVIEIIDEFNLLVNYGLEDGAQIGDKLRIYSPGEAVIDPITKTSLGSLDVIKDTVEVTTPYPNFSICKKIIPIGAPILNPLSQLLKKNRFSEPLNVKQEDMTHREIPEGSAIEVGDLVMLLTLKNN